MLPVGARRRVAAVAALVATLCAVLLFGFIAFHRPVVVVLAAISFVMIVSATARIFVTTGGHRGRWTAAGVVGLVLLVASLLVLALARPVASGLLVVIFLVAVALASYAQRGYVRPSAAPEVRGRPRHLASSSRMLFLNPKSGGGKVETFDLVSEARRRGVRTVVLGPDDDLTTLAEQAIDDGCEVLGMAGGDGSQADVAAVCVRHDRPFVCVPAGTRNHFALDLNLDRSDPRGALDAFVEGIEILVDHGLAGERFFVNNVCLGIYPHLVSDPTYREGRLRAAADLIPALVEDGDDRIDLRFRSPAGTQYATAQMLLVSNNPYRAPGGLDNAGRRISLTGAALGVLVVAVDDADGLAAAARRISLGTSLEQVEGCDQWTASTLRIDSSRSTVLAGVDGEAIELPVPLEIRVVPGALRIIVPVGTPAPPAPTSNLLSVQALTSLAEIAGGIDTGPFGDDL